MEQNKVSYTISDEELISLTTAIKTRYGLDFTNYEKVSLKRGMGRLIQKNNLGSTIGLWSRIMKDKEFLTSCIDEIIVSITDWFHNPEVWIKLKNDFFPKKEEKLDIWHAGCSSGEEVYTMSFLLGENLENSNIIGTDISEKLLDKANSGEYSNISIDRFIKSYTKYYKSSKTDDFFDVGKFNSKVKTKFKEHITYDVHNLVNKPMDRKFDIIFCRNVLVYFDDTLKMKVLKLFNSSLKKGGVLVIGYSDILPLKSSELFKCHDKDSRLYKKIDIDD